MPKADELLEPGDGPVRPEMFRGSGILLPPGGGRHLAGWLNRKLSSRQKVQRYALALERIAHHGAQDGRTADGWTKAQLVACAREALDLEP